MKVSIRKLAVVAAAGLGLMTMSIPASAQNVGVGEVVGGVNITPGIGAVPAVQHFTFVSTVLNVLAGTCGAGTANAAASGGDLLGLVPENYAGGIGTVDNVTVTPGTLNESGTLNGFYVRIGVVVSVALTGSLTGTCSGTAVAVVPVSLFLGNQTPPAAITSASFTGVFALVLA